MIIASGPYISEHFRNTARSNNWPVIDAGGAAAFGLDTSPEFSAPGSMEKVAQAASDRILTTGEHALGWVAEHLGNTPDARAAALFKDKAAFRRQLEPGFPELAFRELTPGELLVHEPAAASYPFVVKPSVGFFSIGVHIVRNVRDWVAARRLIVREVSGAGKHFPEHVLSETRFLLESYIEGEEYAIDASYDDSGEPVVYNILHHRFASGDDVSDRLYVSSRDIIETILPDALNFLRQINSDKAIRNFPLHAEFRCTSQGRLVPIEINPLRFGGWCTTGDFAHYAWGFNSYAYYMNGQSPDWEQVFKGRENREYSLVVLDNSSGVPADRIDTFDYDRLLRRFSHPLHLSRMDYREFPLFGFLFLETADGQGAELDWILRSDLREFIKERP